MMRKYAFHSLLVASVFVTGLLVGHFRAFGQVSQTADPIFGTWKMDLARSVRNRDGKPAPYTQQATRILEPEGAEGLRMTVLNGPGANTAAYSGKFDGKDYPDPRSPGQNRTLAHWRLAPGLIVRLQKSGGKPIEWVVYTVSTDGAVFTAASWVPDKPEYQELQVYTRAQ